MIENFNKILEKYKNFITCVCFMGGDWNLIDLIYFKKEVEKNKLKTAIYSGSDSNEILNKLKELKFNYIKIGSYQEKYGGLNSINTNQKMFMLENEKYINITEFFQKRRLLDV